MANLRLFIAVPIASPVKAALGVVQKTLTDANPHIRSTGVTGIHLTLKFLGDTPDQRIGELRRAMEAAAQVATKPIRLRSAGVGAFPNAKAPRVLWAGLEGDVAELQRVQQELDRQLAQLGFPPEDRPFHPHLTLGRMKMPKMLGALHKAMDKIGKSEFGEFTAAALVLYQSELKPTGAVYTVVEHVPLPEE